MSLNVAHHPSGAGVVVFAGEYIILYCSGVNFSAEGGDNPVMRGSKTGKLYLTTHRLIFLTDKKTDGLRSFSCPFSTLRNVELEQPVFGANHIKGSVKSEPNGGWTGEARLKLAFKHGGAIDFGKAMLEAAKMSSRYAAEKKDDPPPSYDWSVGPGGGPGLATAPPAYYEVPNPNGMYGWMPPYGAFPERPEPSSVYMMQAPPPYPGIGGYASQPPPPTEIGFVDPSTNMVYASARPYAETPQSSSESNLDVVTSFVLAHFVALSKGISEFGGLYERNVLERVSTVGIVVVVVCRCSVACAMMSGKEEPGLQEQFECAVRVIRGLPKEGPYVPSHELQLRFYAHFKQATEGSCPGSRPRMWEPVKRAKWDAWNGLGHMSKDDAMREYVKDLLAIVETMSFTDNVADFLAAMGPLVQYVDLSKVLGEQATEVTLQGETASSQVPSLSHHSSSEAFFSQQEEEREEDDWSTPVSSTCSSSSAADPLEDEHESGDRLKKKLLLPHRETVATKAKASAVKEASPRRRGKTCCSCKDILERMRRDVAVLSERVQNVELEQNKSRKSLESGAALHRAQTLPQSESGAIGGNGRGWSYSLVLVLRRFVAGKGPVLAALFMWPVVLQVAVLIFVRFYFLR
ncbi:unnamed protein product [Notodromas monacha]|uniref:ACB domain-containing protein n=1 Tax=Notodromas monacha TaxID=399045 RepID=A0A7R9BL48_9CRUS|nr:unnamed protein product [Notodromas monacha]CAG0917218.1 unnamed protein product [Notodromas monacha]